MDLSPTLKKLFQGLERRDALPGGAAREGLDAHLLKVVERIRAEVQATLLTDTDGVPPRHVAIALAQALYGQPHLATVFPSPRAESTEDLDLPSPVPPDRPIVLPAEVLREVLGLHDWELDELRDEVDRRVGLTLKQERSLDWLWSHFGLPDASPENMFRVLFPAAPGRMGQVGMARLGAQLYALIDENPPPLPSALYESWTELDRDYTFPPTDTFAARYVDSGLRRRLARGIGSNDAEIDVLLDRMVAVLPRTRCETYLSHELLRVRGFATICGLALPYNRGNALLQPLAPDDVSFEDWLVLRDGMLTTDGDLLALDELATERVDELMKQVYAEMLARLVEEDRESRGGPEVEDLSLYALRKGMRRVLTPLIDWAEDGSTAAHVARELGAERDDAETTMSRVGARWRERIDTFWTGIPDAPTRFTMLGALTQHLLCLHDTLRRAHRYTIPGARYPHADLLLLFAGHYLSESLMVHKLARGLLRGDESAAIATWFLGSWSKLVQRTDPDLSTFSGELHLPDGT